MVFKGTAAALQSLWATADRLALKACSSVSAYIVACKSRMLRCRRSWQLGSLPTTGGAFRSKLLPGCVPLQAVLTLTQSLPPVHKPS